MPGVAHLTTRSAASMPGWARRCALASTCRSHWPVQRPWHARRALLAAQQQLHGPGGVVSPAHRPRRHAAGAVRHHRATDSVDFGHGMEFSARAAVLGMQPDEFKQVVAVVPEAAYMDPSCLFCVREITDLLGASALEMLAAMEQQPKLSNVTAADIEQLLEDLQEYLGLPRRQVGRLLMQDFQLMLMSVREIHDQIQRICRKCRLQAEDAIRLATLAPAVLISNPTRTCTDVLSLSSMLDVSPSTVLDVLAVEQRHFGNARQMLEDLSSLEAGWRGFSGRLAMDHHHTMDTLLQHLLYKQSRYSLRHLPQLSDDVASIAAHSHLQPAFVCAMVLEVPAVVDAPAAFWVVFMDYVLVRRPDWQKQLSQLAPGQVGALELSLLAAQPDSTQLEPADAHFEPADIEYNRDLQLLEALAGKDLVQPEFSKSTGSAGLVKAGRIWRLLYLSNPCEASRAEADLLLVCSQDTQQFCDVYPGYRHWLYNTAFEMEWRDTAGQALSTWDF